MNTGSRKAVVTVSLLATSLLGCDDSPLDRGPELISLVIEAEVRSVVAISGSLPAGIAEGDSLSLALTFLSASARPIHEDSVFAVYNLNPDNENRISTTIGTVDWQTRLYQVLLHNDAPFGDRIAVNGHIYGDDSFTDARFDFRDSTAASGMLSSLAFPRKREDIKQVADGTGGGMLEYGGSGSSWRVSFVCKSLAVK